MNNAGKTSCGSRNEGMRCLILLFYVEYKGKEEKN